MFFLVSIQPLKMRILIFKLFISRLEDLVGVWCSLFDHTILNGIIGFSCFLIECFQAQFLNAYVV